MSSYQFDSIVSNQEAEALKEMIFKRARERAESMTKEAQDSYTGAIKNDIMDMARNTFVANKNPFSLNTDNNTVQPTAQPAKTPEKEVEIGFSQRHIEQIKAQINYRNKTTSEEIANSQIEDTMADARSDFGNKVSFMGALNFLNSQATMSLVEKKGNHFSALA